jgi:hypothetical protein
MPTIQEAIDAAAPGDVIRIPAGVYDAADVALPSNVTLVADGDVTVVGRMTINGSNTTVQGFHFQDSHIDIEGSQGATIRDCVFTGGEQSIHYSWAEGALIANNSFTGVGVAMDGWGLNRSTISGNQIADSGMGINLNFNNDPSQGNDITIEGNTFTNISRMSLEVAGFEGGYTSNLVIRNNWSDNSMVTEPGDGGPVAYSIIMPSGVGTVIEGNYAKGAEGPGIGIELNGAGEIADNIIDTYQFGIIAYSDGFNIHDNTVANTSIESVLNYYESNGYMGGNAIVAASVDAPPPPVSSTDGSTTPPVDSANGDGTTVPPVDATDGDGTTAPPVDAANGDGTTAPDVGVLEPSQPTEPTPDSGETSGHATVWGRGFAGEDPALTASDAGTLQAAYQSAIDERDSAWIRFNVEGSAALDHDSISLRDEALVALDAANPTLKIGFTVTAQSTGLDETSLNLLQSAMNDGVHIDAVKVLVQDPEQLFGDTRAELRGAAAATREQLADLGLDATVRFAWDQDGAASAEAAAADTGGTTVQPFEFSGVLNQQQVDQIG